MTNFKLTIAITLDATNYNERCPEYNSGLMDTN